MLIFSKPGIVIITYIGIKEEIVYAGVWGNVLCKAKMVEEYICVDYYPCTEHTKK